MKRSSTRTAPVPAFAVAVTALLALLGLLWWEATFLNGLLNVLHRYALVLLVLAVGVALIGFGWWMETVAPAAFGLCLGIGGFIGFGTFGGFKADQQLNSATVVTTKQTGTYQLRAPFEVATALAPNAVRTNGDLNTDDTTYLPERGLYATPVTARVFMGGYTEIVSQKIGPTGSVTTRNCTFSADAKASLDGHLSHSLVRSIVRASRGAIIDKADAYGYCQGSTPIVVVPLKQYVGFFPVTQRPAGVALYNGATGKTRIIREVKPGSIPGPVYPLSLAQAQRDATLASGSFFDWVFERVGYSSTGHDNGDPNRTNNGEFTLSPTKGGAQYVTPVTRKGRGTAIVAVATLDADRATDGRLSPLSIHTLPTPRNANSNVSSQIKGNYSELAWATPGFGIFEVVPTGPGTWIATVGLNQTITNRITVAADGTTCLQSATGTPIRCANQPAKTGQQSPTTGTGSTPTAPVSDLSTLTDAQLADLGKRVSDEWVRRAK